MILIYYFGYKLLRGVKVFRIRSALVQPAEKLENKEFVLSQTAEVAKHGFVFAFKQFDKRAVVLGIIFRTACGKNKAIILFVAQRFNIPKQLFSVF